MSKIYEKSKFVEYLRETPLVSFACKKVGISRATYYRWYKDDREFRESIQKVLKQGRANINDLAEATLIKMIKGENFNATRFWLQHNSNRYVPVRTTYIEPATHDHVDLKPGETCTYCGTKSKVRPPGGGGFYEREIEEKKVIFEAEAKKRKKLTGREKREFMAKMEMKKKGIESYERLVESFPDDITFKHTLQSIKDGTMEYVEHGFGMGMLDKDHFKKIREKKEKGNDTIEDVVDRE